jgi:hypothetical protein
MIARVLRFALMDDMGAGGTMGGPPDHLPFTTQDKQKAVPIPSYISNTKNEPASVN